MKLISFAVVSLLAITVSAYPQQSTSTQDVQSYQSTSTPDFTAISEHFCPRLHSHLRALLLMMHSHLRVLPLRLHSHLTKIKFSLRTKAIVELEDTTINIDVQLQMAGLKADKRSQLTEKLDRLSALLKKLCGEYKEYQQPYENAMKKRNDAKAELQLLKENQRLMSEYNSKHGVQVGPSPDSVYNLSILTKQNTDILERINALLQRTEKSRA
ncbi:hypothetical protein BASA62_001197 [Batrachochytrium salamandrivorans]|nr:hypothetical protein BASA62_001197 [Batrachochytrium salamandrivorans]